MKDAAVQLTIAQLRKIAKTADSAATAMGWQDQYPDVDTYKIPPPPSADPKESQPLITHGDKWQPSKRLLHIHNYWHRYIALLVALTVFLIALFGLKEPQGVDMRLFIGGLAGSIIGLQIWGVLAFFRTKVQDASNIHKIGRKSPVFKLGAALGLAFYVYTNGVPALALPEEFTRQTVRFAAFEFIKLAAEIYGGGKILELLAYRFLGYDPEDDEDEHEDDWTGSAIKPG